MASINIVHRYTGNLIFSGEFSNIICALKEAVRLGADFRGADFGGAYLSGARFRDTNLSGADFSGAYFGGADFSGADFRGAIFYGSPVNLEPLQLYGLIWDVVITENHLRIGCEVHTHDEWSSFSNRVISTMERGAVPFWRENQSTLLALCAQQREKGAKK